MRKTLAMTTNTQKAVDSLLYSCAADRNDDSSITEIPPEKEMIVIKAISIT
jgi:hypothetical protein